MRLLFLSLALVSSTLTAANIDSRQALELAYQIYGEMQDPNLGSDLLLEIVAQDIHHAQPAYYVCQPKNGEGFVIVSGNDQQPELLGYSTTGSWEQALRIEPFAKMIGTYADVTACKSTQSAASANRNQEQRPILTVSEVINPLCHTLWHQSAPYYNLCPMQGDVHCLTGCTATAMAQVMYYHQYPVNPTGTGSATMAYSPLPDVDFSQYTLDWDNMLTNYAHVEYTETQANAVATLMMLCGFGAQMNYSATGSGANVVPARRAMIQNFGYSTTTRLYLRESYTRDHWLSMITDELLAGRPIIYSGRTSTNDGHTFVCDGTGLRGTVHVNWGWGDGVNINVDVDVMAPHGSNDGYTFNNQMMIGIQPALEGEDRAIPYNLDVCDSVTYKPSNKMVVLPAVWNLGSESVTLSIGFQIEKEGQVVDNIILKKNVSIGVDNKINPIYAILKLPTTLEDGTYVLRMGVQQTSTGEWLDLNSGDMPTALQFTITDGEASYEGYTALREVRADRYISNSTENKQTIYDSMGRRVNQMQSNKIYIVNGKQTISF